MARVPQLIGLMQSITGASTGGSVDMNNYPQDYRSFVAKVTGTGSVSATVLVEASSDNSTFFTLVTFTLTGTTSDTDGAVTDDSWRFIRGRVTAISGTGASVDLTMRA